MIAELIKVDDTVVINIEKESRQWGYNPCPEGSLATVLGFDKIYYGRVNNHGHKPGAHQNTSWVRVKLADGTEHTEWNGRLTLFDSAELAKREEEYQKAVRADLDWFRNHQNDGFIEDLPETPFYEGDKVIFSRYSPSPLIVIGVDYSYLNRKIDNGSPWPCYIVSDSFTAGWHTSAPAEGLELIERGNVWKYFHKEPIQFKDIEEEANFFSLLGHFKEVRNSATGLFDWTKDEVLAAIQRGEVHGFSLVRPGFLGNDFYHMAKVFDDAELGKRVAAATLKGFELEPIAVS